MVGPGGRQSQRYFTRGQAEVIGVVLVLALTLIGATLALVLGATALDNARVDSQEGSIEHAMTQLDSRAAMVALGDSEVQRVRMAATGSGVYSADPDAGRIVITHLDYDGAGSDKVIYNETLGAVVYQKDDKRIAYQGGGVWIAQGSWSKMVSPPEFQYRGATLTLPVIRVQNGGVAGGSSTVAEVKQLSRAERIYPNLSTTYDGSRPYTNPIREGNVTVEVTSDYYQAWAEYFRTRTEGKVTVDHANKTARVKLLTIGITGRFVMPADGNSIQLRGLASGHLISDFSLTLFDDDQDSADFSNLKWSMYADEGSQNFEIHLRDESGGKCGGDVGLTIYYTDNNGANYSSWTNKSAYQYECENESLGTDFNDDGDHEDKRLVVNLTSQTQLKYEPVKGGDGKLLFFSISGSDTFDDPEEFVKHNGVDWEPETFNQGDLTSIDNVTNHYLTLMGPRVELTVDDVAGNTVNEQASHGDFEQEGAEGKFITFLQITENRVSIELE